MVDAVAAPTKDVVSLSLQPPRPFEYSVESRTTAGQRWPRWLRECQRYLSSSRVVNERQKKDAFLYLVGSDVCDIYDQQTKATETYEEAVTL
jgi:hypothetical protein